MPPTTERVFGSVRVQRRRRSTSGRRGPGRSRPACHGWQRPIRRIAHPDPAAEAVDLDRLAGVLGAGRREATARRRAGHHHLVAVDRAHPGPRRERRSRGHAAARRQSPSARRSSAKDASAAAGRRADEVRGVGADHDAVLAQRGAQAAADPVAGHGVADAATDREADLRARARAPGRAGPTRARDDTRGRGPGGRRSHGGGYGRSGREARAPAGAPRLEHGPPGARAHPAHGIRASSCASGCSAGRSASRMASSGGEWAPTTPGEGGPGLGMGRQRGECIGAGPPLAMRATRPADRADAAPRRGRSRRSAARTVWTPDVARTRSARMGDGSLTTRAHQSRAWGQHHHSARNYSHETRDCSLESAGVGC